MLRREEPVVKISSHISHVSFRKAVKKLEEMERMRRKPGEIMN
jgi:hypothetical protein